MIGTAICLVSGIWSAVGVVDMLLVIAVERTEIACVEAHLLVDVPSSAKTQ